MYPTFAFPKQITSKTTVRLRRNSRSCLGSRFETPLACYRIGLGPPARNRRKTEKFWLRPPPEKRGKIVEKKENGPETLSFYFSAISAPISGGGRFLCLNLFCSKPTESQVKVSHTSHQGSAKLMELLGATFPQCAANGHSPTHGQRPHPGCAMSAIRQAADNPLIHKLHL